MTNLKSLDDYTKLPDGYTDYDTDKILETVCNETLESLANEMIKRRIIYEPKTYIFSTTFNKNDFLSGFTTMKQLLAKHENCVIIHLNTYYKPMKMRKRNRGVRKWKI